MIKSLKKVLLTFLTILLLNLTAFTQSENALFFDGNDKVVIENQDFNLENQITIMGWLNWSVEPDLANNWANIIGISNGNDNDEQFLIQHNSDNNKLEFVLVLKIGEEEANRRFIWSNRLK
jgi:hypothetical protein